MRYRIWLMTLGFLTVGTPPAHTKKPPKATCNPGKSTRTTKDRPPRERAVRGRATRACRRHGRVNWGPGAHAPGRRRQRKALVDVAKRVKLGRVERGLARALRRYTRGGLGFRLLIETDKPVFQPGESIWVRVVQLQHKRNRPFGGKSIHEVSLRNPKGQRLQKHRILARSGHSASSFALPESAPGGEYTVEARDVITGATSEKRIMVQVYQAPRIKKKLEFTRKAYGPGDKVAFWVRLHRATGPALGMHRLTASLRVQGRHRRSWGLRTDSKGYVTASFALPHRLQSDDWTLTIAIKDAGVTESISRAVPLRFKRLRVGFFAEGGHAVIGLPSRVYVAARRASDGDPVDFSGVIEDQSGKIHAHIRSFHDGMGRFVYTPQSGARYTLRITRPTHASQRFPLPDATPQGVTFQLVDDFASSRPSVRLRVYSKKARRVSVTALQHEQLIAHRAFALKAGVQMLHLPLRKRWRGVVRITLFDARMRPLAERLTFRHVGRGLRISVEPDKTTYQPRETVTLKLKVRAPNGKPLPRAILGVSVVDDTVLAQADDQEPHLLAQRFLTSQLTGEIHKPNFYFDPKEAKAPRALDLVMGTHGWRDFSWKAVKRGDPPPLLRPFASLKRPLHSPMRVNQLPRPQRFARKMNRIWLRPSPHRIRVGGRFYRKKTVYDFSADTITGDLTRPDGEYIEARKSVRHVRLYRKRQSFRKRRFPPTPRAQQHKRKPRRRARRRHKRLVAIRLSKRRHHRNKRPRRGHLAPLPRKQNSLPYGIIRRKNRFLVHHQLTFAKNKSRLPKTQRTWLKRFAHFLKRHPAQIVCIDGHADTREHKRPMRLAQRRADAIRQQLHQLGILTDRLQMTAPGHFIPYRQKPILQRRNQQVASPPKPPRHQRYQGVSFRLQHHTQSRPCLQHEANYQMTFTRLFPTHFYRKTKGSKVRSDFRETLLWAPNIRTNHKGEATVRFGLNDSITSFRVRTSAVGGRTLGMHSHLITSQRPFFLTHKAPLAVSADDAMAIPLTLRNNTKQPLTLRVHATLSPTLKLTHDPLTKPLRLRPGQALTAYYSIRAHARSGEGSITFRAHSKGFSDALHALIPIHPRGFPRTWKTAGTLHQKTTTFSFHLPKRHKLAAPRIQLHLYPHPMHTVLKSLSAMLREPHGCFEQTSSSNYPNVMIIQTLRATGTKNPALLQRTKRLLRRGYQKLVQFETKSRGFEWFGRAPGHEALSAYGLLQFHDMKEVFPSVSQTLIQRTQRWLHSRRDAKGGYMRNRRALDTFGRTSAMITNAYITFALAEHKAPQLQKPLAQSRRNARKQRDPYLLALALNATIQSEGVHSPHTQPLLRMLLRTRRHDGSFRGLRHSITHSMGQNLHIETTALAALAMLRANVPLPKLHPSIQWLQAQRRPYGGFGTTQATILTLRTLLAYHRKYGHPGKSGTLFVSVNGKPARVHPYTVNSAKPVSIRDLEPWLQPGKNTIQLKLQSKHPVPFNFGVRFFTRKPKNHPLASLTLQTRLLQTRLKMGQLARLEVKLHNRTPRTLPMTLVRISYPGSLRHLTRQLKTMHKQKRFAFYETRPRELILYLHRLKPHQRKTFLFDLKARVTGNYTSAASSAYLYYTDERKTYSPPLHTNVSP